MPHHPASNRRLRSRPRISPPTGRAAWMSAALVPGLVVGLAWVVVAIAAPSIASAQALMVDYEVVFEPTWSAATHPVEFPTGPHFSPLVGATHDQNVRFWEPGSLASDGIESMAEQGQTGTLANEINAEISAGFADQLILGNGVGSPGSTTVSFTAHQDHPLLTLVSMLAPSPDWFIGVHDLPLFDQGLWVLEQVVDLYVYDAGTDLGPSYESPDADENPQSPVALQGAPLEAGVPVGSFTIRRLPEPGLGAQLAAATICLYRLARRRVGRPRI
jgi:hypothetical protein